MTKSHGQSLVYSDMIDEELNFSFRVQKWRSCDKTKLKRKEPRFLIPYARMLQRCAACRVGRPKSPSNVRFCPQYKSSRVHYTRLHCQWPVNINNYLLPTTVPAPCQEEILSKKRLQVHLLPKGGGGGSAKKGK